MKINVKKQKSFEECYQVVEKALVGLEDIFDINFCKFDYFHEAAMDNLQAIKDNLNELLSCSDKHEEVKKNLRDKEFIDFLKTYPRILPP
jgi:hypothetical protein